MSNGDAEVNEPPRFKHLWEPEKLSALRDTMEYDGHERLLQRAQLGGWIDAEARERGVTHNLGTYSTNRRDELTRLSAGQWSSHISEKMFFVLLCPSFTSMITRTLNRCIGRFGADSSGTIQRR